MPRKLTAAGDLVMVESTAKAETIERYRGQAEHHVAAPSGCARGVSEMTSIDWRVASSAG